MIILFLPTMMKLRADNLVKIYKKRKVVKDI
jgi:lipopolysaccharide export system ATP-binding protein